MIDAPTLLGRAVVLSWGVGLVLFPLFKRLPMGYVPLIAGLGVGWAIWCLRGHWTSRMARVSDTTFVSSVLLVALGLRLAAATCFPVAPANDHEMFYRLAASVARGTGYGWGYGPSAFFPPGLPLLLAAWFVVAGVGLWQAKMLGIAIGMSCVWATYRFAVWSLGPAAGRCALVIAATSPTLVFYSATLGYEQLLAVVFVCWAVLVEMSAGTRLRGGISLQTGALMGAGALIKPVCLLLPAVCLIRWWRTAPVAAVARTCLCGLAMMAIVLPWTARNWAALGSPVLVSTNGGVVLYAANNPASEGLAMQVAPLPGEHDEVSRDRVRTRAAVKWIFENPGAWAHLAVAKIAYVWGTSSSIMSYVSYDRMGVRAEDVCKGILNVGWSALFVLCCTATFKTTAWSRPRLCAAALCLAYFFVLHLFFEALSRHHIAVMPFLITIAAAGLVAPAARMSDSETAAQGHL